MIFVNTVLKNYQKYFLISLVVINSYSIKYNIEKDKILMIGDRVYTDIASGKNANCVTVCVLSGEATIDTINNSNIKPDFIFDSIKDLID